MINTGSNTFCAKHCNYIAITLYVGVNQDAGLLTMQDCGLAVWYPIMSYDNAASLTYILIIDQRTAGRGHDANQLALTANAT